jgi:undecaprenyl-diphosphatase
VNWIEGIILGIIQGIGEPIPVSSSAQTMVASFLMMVETPGILFEVFLNFASFLAILWLTRKDVYAIIKGFLLYSMQGKKEFAQEFRMATYVVIGTIPAMIFGLSMKDLIDNYLSSMTTIGVALIITGLFLYLVRKLNGRRGEEQMTWKDALIVGLVQGTVSLIPGISRSGSTIVAALYAGLNKETSFRYSFLLYLPIGFGAMVLGAEDLVTDPLFQSNFWNYMIMFVVTFFMTIFGYQLFKGVMERGKLIYFSIYCWALGVSLLIFF